MGVRDHKIGGKPAVLLMLILFLPLGVALALYTGNPFADLEVGERPLKVMLLFKVCGVLIALACLARLITWASWRVTPEALERRGWFGRRRFERADLLDKALSSAGGVPPMVKLRFSTGTARFLAAQLKPADHAALNAFIAGS